MPRVTRGGFPRGGYNTSVRANFETPPPRNGRYGYWNHLDRFVPFDESPVRPAMWIPPTLSLIHI